MDSQPDFILTQQPHENAIAIHILPLCDLLHRCLDVLNHIKPLVRLQKVKVETPSPTWDHPSGFNTHTCTLLILPHHLEGNVWSFFGDGIDKKIQGFITLPTWNLGVSVEKISWYLGEHICLLAMIGYHLGDILSFVAAFLFGHLKPTKNLRSNNSLLTL